VASVVRALACTCTEAARRCVRISGKGKRGRESFRCDSQSVPRRERQTDRQTDRERERGGGEWGARAMKSQSTLVEEEEEVGI